MYTSCLPAEEVDKAKAWCIGDTDAHETNQRHNKPTVDGAKGTKYDDGVHGYKDDSDLDEL